MPTETAVLFDALNTPESRLAYQFIQQTNQALFLTGKAGTGKTTFLQYVKQHIQKNYAVVAPTAVAALNVGGVTIHSFFQVPRGPLLSAEHTKEVNRFSYSLEKFKLLQHLELLIIDEISMVRVDLLDYIDQVLRYVKGTYLPFGGIQLLMVGDLYQLPPVYEKEWPVLKAYYSSPFFFDSNVIKKCNLLTIELTQIFRQSDPVFIGILNEIRSGQISMDILRVLNERYKSGAVDPDDQITLTTHNPLVAEINQRRLTELTGEAFTFRATVSGEFPRDAYPAENILLLKNGAQVMFIKNDSTGKKEFYNGRKAKVTDISNQHIRVTFDDDHTEFTLMPETWHYLKYSLNQDEGKIAENSAGSFTQYPIKLAWAITIHKSQGLTFDKVIINVGGAFAHGQTYVALSRCRTLEGITLQAPVRQENLMMSRDVIGFMEKAALTVPDELTLKQSIRSFELQMVIEAFNFEPILNRWIELTAGFDVELPEALASFNRISKILSNELVANGSRFIRKELAGSDAVSGLKEQPEKIIRLQTAADFFLPKITNAVNDLHSLFSGVKQEEVFSVLNQVLFQLTLKSILLGYDFGQFEVASFLATYRRHTTTFKPVSKKALASKAEKELKNPRLFNELLNWRKVYSAAKNVPDYTIISERLLKAIAEKESRSLDELSAIKGMGQQKALEFGEDLLKLIALQRGEQQLFD
ncbi:AAA family ATPase [Mucilaginibacter flavidus]|uniref:AAA family ATPase n=1 Tax=Mucilaginibacter flavidus TaxID=2949309 RepID=UPI002092D455|nr:AAA family ATPase [Mucilaginibacter flavidus]MCO5950531.1 AAA family ATPase [Mucilaginibacter flavidus]